MSSLLDRFQVLVRSCRPLPPDGYELTVEVRRNQPPRPQPAPTDNAQVPVEEPAERQVPA
jgi:hypothetical protein